MSIPKTYLKEVVSFQDSKTGLYDTMEIEVESPLTDVEIAYMVVFSLTGLENKHLASLRDRSIQTVKNQLEKLYRKLRVENRGGMAAFYNHEHYINGNFNAHDIKDNEELKSMLVQLPTLADKFESDLDINPNIFKFDYLYHTVGRVLNVRLEDQIDRN